MTESIANHSYLTLSWVKNVDLRVKPKPAPPGTLSPGAGGGGRANAEQPGPAVTAPAAARDNGSGGRPGQTLGQHLRPAVTGQQAELRAGPKSACVWPKPLRALTRAVLQGLLR
jgi:hypothetical protein